MNKEEIIKNSIFYRWSTIESTIRKEKPLEFEMDDFFDDIRKDPPETSKPFAYVINKTMNGKTADDFYCPHMVFIDVDFHFDNEQDKIKELKKFFNDVEVNTLQEFVDKLSKDKYCISAGLSKSGVGIRMFFSVITNFYEDSLKHNLDYSTDMNKQIHKSNWEYVMRYLSLNYNFDLDAKYAGGEVRGLYKGDTSANKLSQVTFRYRKTGSFYNQNWESLYNKECYIKESKKYTITDDIEKYEVPFLDEIYNNNLDSFKVAFSHYDKAMTYTLRHQPIETQRWFYEKIKEHYIGDGLRKNLNTFEDFQRVFSGGGGDDLPLKSFLFKRGIFYGETFTLQDELIDQAILKKDDEDDEDKNIIPDSIYKKLPQILQDLTHDFSDEKRDIILLSSINILGYYFSNIKFEYFYRTDQFNNFYLFIIAPSASGKSIMNNSKLLLSDLDKYYRDKFVSEITAYNLQTKKTGAPPVQIVILTGGDATRQGITRYMEANNGRLNLFDTEADNLVSQKGEYEYTTLMRKSIQNESNTKILASQNAQYIDSPKLNICVSGTKSQVLNALGKNSGENGTLNRFMFYNWDCAPSLEDPHAKMKNKNIFKDYSKMLFDFYIENLYLDGVQEFEFTDQQNELFFSLLDMNHKSLVKIEDDTVSGIVKRHYLIAKKMCVTIAGLRKFDVWKLEQEDLYSEKSKIDFSKLDISNEDMINVIDIVKVLIKHSLGVSRKFIPDDEVVITTSWKVDLYNVLKDTFTRKDVMTKKKLFGDKTARTIDRWLKSLRNDDDINYNEETKLYTKLKQRLE